MLHGIISLKQMYCAQTGFQRKNGQQIFDGLLGRSFVQVRTKRQQGFAHTHLKNKQLIYYLSQLISQTVINQNISYCFFFFVFYIQRSVISRVIFHRTIAKRLISYFARDCNDSSISQRQIISKQLTRGGGTPFSNESNL